MNRKNCGLMTLLIFSLVSCTTIKNEISVFVYNENDVFISSLTFALSTEYKDKFSFNLQYASSNQTKQNSQIVDKIDSSSLLVVNVVDRLSSSVILEKAEANNVPTIFFNRQPLEEDMTSTEWRNNNVYYVGGNPVSQGEMQAQIANIFFGGSEQFKLSSYDKNKNGELEVAILKGEQGHQDTEIRTKKSITKLRNYNYSVNVIETKYCNWSRSEAFNAMEDFYSSDIELLLSNNDEMALGCIEYLTSTTRSTAEIPSYDPSKKFEEQFFPIIGVDATEGGRRAVDNDFMLGTVLNDAKKQASIISSLTNYILSNVSLPIFDDSIDISGKYYLVNGSMYM